MCGVRLLQADAMTLCWLGPRRSLPPRSLLRKRESPRWGLTKTCARSTTSTWAASKRHSRSYRATRSGDFPRSLGRGKNRFKQWVKAFDLETHWRSQWYPVLGAGVAKRWGLDSRLRGNDEGALTPAIAQREREWRRR